MKLDKKTLILLRRFVYLSYDDGSIKRIACSLPYTIDKNGRIINSSSYIDKDVKEEIEKQLEKKEETFSETLFKIIDEKGIKDSTCYKKANIDRKLFSKIRSNKNYHPRKNTILSLALALELSLDDTKNLLNKAGYCFSTSSKKEIIIEFFISRHIYDIDTINEGLAEFNEPLLTNF